MKNMHFYIKIRYFKIIVIYTNIRIILFILCSVGIASFTEHKKTTGISLNKFIRQNVYEMLA